ncbi:hypothetical protein C3Y94_028300 [Rhizobium ruizarguesonis]|uniref:hypothetical protein n=1 Tax=Rhizobium ruizarguesonis TaxID=2081791 RepID=UPI00163B1E26|nr:hypothetical protein [Rhizobium ruizarguesonis]MBC2807033.1 hypothetical protein [Rhizobium ruizarguesonis]
MAEEIRNSTKLARPRNWQDFERVTRDYYAESFDNHDVSLNGRQGQNQRGVDVHGNDRWHDNRLVGIQCKGLNDPEFNQNKLISPSEFRQEVEKAKTFDPNLKQFILLSTAPGDTDLDALARKLTDEHKKLGLFEVTYHGWDWFEYELYRFPRLIREYGLATFIEAPERSDVAIQIGERFASYIELANREADPGNTISLQTIARHLGEPDWRRLERIRVGTSLVSDVELRELSETLGIDTSWLIDGVGKPFSVTRGIQHEQVRPMFRRIAAYDPKTIHIVRQASPPYEAAISIEINSFRYQVFDKTYTLQSHMGGGVHNSFDLWCLIIKLRSIYGEYGGRIRSYHLPNETFNNLMSGNMFPGTLLKKARSDTWWHDFADLAFNLMPEVPTYWAVLASATSSVRGELNRVRDGADPLNLELLRWIEAADH